MYLEESQGFIVMILDINMSVNHVTELDKLECTSHRQVVGSLLH